MFPVSNNIWWPKAMLTGIHLCHRLSLERNTKKHMGHYDPPLHYHCGNAGFLQQNNISAIPWLSKTTIIVIVYALGKPHPKSGTIWGWKEQLLTFQDNHYDLDADMTQHDEPDNKNRKKKQSSIGRFQMSLQGTSPNAFLRGEAFNMHQVGELLRNSTCKAWAGLQANIVKRIVDIYVCCNPREKNNY